MAAPHVAGVAALAKGINPALTNVELRSVLESSAEDIGVPGRDNQFGFGLVDAYAATLAAGTSEPVNHPPVADFSFARNGLQVNFTDLSTDQDGIVTAWSWDFGDGAASASATTSHSYQAAGTYAVTLTVIDDAGAKDAGTKEVSVWDGDMTMSVKDIALSVSSRGRLVQARAQITILNVAGLPVEGATISAAWSGAVAANATGVTGADGKVVLLSPRFRSGNQITIQVKTITDDLYLYNPAGNTETSDTLSW
jgi:PKD repeat protein